MRLIKQDNLNKIITEKYSHDFVLADDGLYLIEIIASAKSWWQNLKSFRSFFSDDDLAVKIDDLEFPKQSGKAGLFDSEMAWNGNRLKGLFKTGLIAVFLNAGAHAVTFFNDAKPLVKNIKISKVEEKNKIIYIPSENNPAENGNRRPWLSLALVNLTVSGVIITAKADKRENDDDDIKLIINGKIQTNGTSKAHKNWYWCGKILKGADLDFANDLKLDSSLHYLELWADGEPFLKKVEVDFAKSSGKEKRRPTVDDPEWTGDFNDDSEQMILARAIFGEARSLSEKGRIAVGWSIKNRVIDVRWGNNYHDVILEAKQYSAIEESDPNYSYVLNPLLDASQTDDWRECYKIAGQVMKGEVQDPTGGANHYYSDYIIPPLWVKDKNTLFKLKIGNTLFYEIIKGGANGFVKLFLLLLLVAIMAAGFLLFRHSVIDAKVLEIETSRDIKYRHYFINPKNQEIYVLYLDGQGNTGESKQLTFDQYPKSHLEVFYDNELIGYFQNIHKYGETDPAGEEVYYKDYVKLMIKRGEKGEPEEVYRGDVHTSYWKWYDKNRVNVYYGCGTHCLYYYRININTKKAEEEGHAYE